MKKKPKNDRKTPKNGPKVTTERSKSARYYRKKKIFYFFSFSFFFVFFFVLLLLLLLYFWDPPPPRNENKVKTLQKKSIKRKKYLDHVESDSTSI